MVLFHLWRSPFSSVSRRKRRWLPQFVVYLSFSFRLFFLFVYTTVRLGYVAYVRMYVVLLGRIAVMMLDCIIYPSTPCAGEGDYGSNPEVSPYPVAEYPQSSDGEVRHSHFALERIASRPADGCRGRIGENRMSK